MYNQNVNETFVFTGIKIKVAYIHVVIIDKRSLKPYNLQIVDYHKLQPMETSLWQLIVLQRMARLQIRPVIWDMISVVLLL